MSLAALRGKVVVLAPFLSLCQDECPLVTGAFIALQRDLRAAGLAHQVVFVEATVDPGRDTVARLAAYQKEFGADWDLWTGTPATSRRSGSPSASVPERPRGAAAEDDWLTGQPLTYDVDHTDGYILIDPPGASASSTPPRRTWTGARPEADLAAQRGRRARAHHPQGPTGPWPTPWPPSAGCSARPSRPRTREPSRLRRTALSSRQPCVGLALAPRPPAAARRRRPLRPADHQRLADPALEHRPSGRSSPPAAATRSTTSFPTRRPTAPA